MASKGPSYSSLNEVEEQTEARRRGLQTKPHHVTEDEMTAMAKRALRGRKK